jgi:phospholipase C
MDRPTALRDMHPGWRALLRRLRRHTSRRQFMSQAALSASGLALWSLLPAGCGGSGGSSGGQSSGQSGQSGSTDQASWPSNTPIRHVVILCQENHSFDNYFGSFAATLGSGANTALGFSPDDLTYYNAAGAAFHPLRLTQFCELDPDHGWEGSHSKWNNGAMDGWITDQGGNPGAIGYFEAADHIYHATLAQAFTIADHNFCSQIGPTVPNRLYLWSGTSGWDYLSPTAVANALPYNNPVFTLPPPTLQWQTMADVLDAAKLPWKCYSLLDGSIPSAVGAFNPLVFFKQFQDNPSRLAQATADFSEFASDLAAGKLPAVSWIITEAIVSEHPPAPPDLGQLFVAKVVQQLMSSSAWSSSALFVTYDEGGGYFEHVPPQILEDVPGALLDAGLAVGPGFRVPLTIVSPFAPPNNVFKGVMDHTCILQFIERNFSTAANPVTLPTITAARRDLADLTGAFDFTQAANTPSLPTAQDLYGQARKVILDPNTPDGCSTDLPAWLLQLLGA